MYPSKNFVALNPLLHYLVKYEYSKLPLNFHYSVTINLFNVITFRISSDAKSMTFMQQFHQCRQVIQLPAQLPVVSD